METTLGELVSRLGGELVGDPAVVVRQIAALDKAEEGDLAFLVSPKYRAALGWMPAGTALGGLNSWAARAK